MRYVAIATLKLCYLVRYVAMLLSALRSYRRFIFDRLLEGDQLNVCACVCVLSITPSHHWHRCPP
jgi:hypothetical protein